MKNHTTRHLSGFTIVELLIVVAVIGILAAITVVAYRGITTQANLNAARSNAVTVRDAAGSYASSNGPFPSLSQLQAGATHSKLPQGIAVSGTGTMTALNTNIYYVNKGTTGACIGYKPANTSTMQWIYAGDANTGTEASTGTCT